jgi:2',3'-cyclic-nucleotide 2'-phosphodiesterase (5'-nucleotidase family)
VKLTWCLLALVFPLACAASAQQPVIVTIAAINDFHGNLEPPTESVTVGGASVRAGGVARLATLVGRLRARSPNFAFVSAGDLFGASPLASAAFDEEPTIEAMNLAGLDFNGVGNHEFDRGAAHLRRMQQGGCPADGCKSGASFAGSRFGMLAANVVARDTGKPLFPAYGIKDYGGVKVAFIGAALKQTPIMLSPAARAGARLPRRGRDGQLACARVEAAGRASDRRAAAPGRHHRRQRERVRRSRRADLRYRAPARPRGRRRGERAYAPRLHL